jgi:DNA-binding CsgD family transcriptional regulator
MGKQKRLTEKSALVLGMIAEGHSYSQIVDGNSGLSYLDIFAAAEEALRLCESQSDYHARMVEIKERYPRAYERWSEDDDRRLAALFGDGNSAATIGRQLGRQPSAIRSRLAKLNLVSANRALE